MEFIWVKSSKSGATRQSLGKFTFALTDTGADTYSYARTTLGEAGDRIEDRSWHRSLSCATIASVRFADCIGRAEEIVAEVPPTSSQGTGMESTDSHVPAGGDH